MRRSEPAPSGDRRRFPLRRSAFTTGAGVLCAGLFYGYVLVPLGVIAAAGGGIGIALFLKRRGELAEDGNGNE